ncbi:HNH endonuclease signature motif containing protein [Microbacterium istanbulense]|uniref:HNH endonuclease signature motif containing protein n=1 Tax=Microbacterium istanbulense TaxID=3122049 RepID=A0ABU8LPV2_9MICO
MVFLTEVAELLPTLRGRLGADADLRCAVGGLTDAEVVAVLREASELTQQVEQVRAVAAGVVAARSVRSEGHAGLSQARGHRSPASLVQEITGASRADAARQVRVGEALVGAGADADSSGGAVEVPGAEVRAPWFEPLRVELRQGMLTTTQFDVIRRGLGEPPITVAGTEVPDDVTDVDTGPHAVGAPRVLTEEEAAELTAATTAAWAHAAGQLCEEAAQRTVEELGAAARAVRDLLDPAGAEARFLARFEKRSLRIWRDAEGVMHARIDFDDEGALFFASVIDAAMRPRRGGPRFVDDAERERAAALTDDPRTNDQLTYDLVFDVLRAGVLAEPAAVFGTKQPGVRLVQVVQSTGLPAPVAHAEDGLHTVPGRVAEQHQCSTGHVHVTVDGAGNPLNVGREHRLFTPTQRLGLALRDGGCAWNGCDRPASYCEAHHIDEWTADGGRTDIDRGILLCRFHHMNLHHHGWRITRDARGPFVLHGPAGETFILKRRTALGYAWAGIDPPPPRFRPMIA